MRIALFTEVYLPYINGVVTHVKVLKDGLEKLGHTVLVVTADPTAKKHFVENGVLHCPATEMKKIYGFGAAWPLSSERIKILKKFNPDVIHIHTEFFIGVSGALLARSLKKPLVWTMHTMYDDYIYYVAPEKFVDIVKGVSHKYFQFIMKKADAITGPSDKVTKYLKERGVTREVHIIPNPVEIDMFDATKISAEARIQLRRDLHIARDKTVACFVGRLGAEKSVDVILNYWKEQIKPEDNLHLLVIGDGPARLGLIALAKELGIDQMVTFTGKIMHDELPPYYSICSMYVTASLSDTNSISMKEGMAAGLPVVHIKDELNKGQVVHGVNGFIYENAQQFAEALRMLRDMNQTDMNELRQRVLAIIHNASDVALATALLDVYAEAAEHKKQALIKKEERRNAEERRLKEQKKARKKQEKSSSKAQKEKVRTKKPRTKKAGK